MNWLEKVIAYFKEIPPEVWKLMFWGSIYLFAGAVVARIYWYFELKKYGRDIKQSIRDFLKSRGLQGDSIPDNLKGEWSEYLHKKPLSKPTFDLGEALTWPLLVIGVIIHFALIWPARKMFSGFGGLNRWIEKKALGDIESQLPKVADIESEKDRLAKEVLKSFGHGKTIGPGGGCDRS